MTLNFHKADSIDPYCVHMYVRVFWRSIFRLFFAGFLLLLLSLMQTRHTDHCNLFIVPIRLLVLSCDYCSFSLRALFDALVFYNGNCLWHCVVYVILKYHPQYIYISAVSCNILHFFKGLHPHWEIYNRLKRYSQFTASLFNLDKMVYRFLQRSIHWRWE